MLRASGCLASAVTHNTSQVTRVKLINNLGREAAGRTRTAMRNECIAECAWKTDSSELEDVISIDEA